MDSYKKVEEKHHSLGHCFVLAIGAAIVSLHLYIHVLNSFKRN